MTQTNPTAKVRWRFLGHDGQPTKPDTLRLTATPDVTTTADGTVVPAFPVLTVDDQGWLRDAGGLTDATGPYVQLVAGPVYTLLVRASGGAATTVRFAPSDGDDLDLRTVVDASTVVADHPAVNLVASITTTGLVTLLDGSTVQLDLGPGEAETATTTDAGALITGVLDPARLGDNSITGVKLAASVRASLDRADDAAQRDSSPPWFRATRVALFGHSFTGGDPGMLADLNKRNGFLAADNFGSGGTTTGESALAAMAGWTPGRRGYALLLCSVNDNAHYSSQGVPGLALATYKRSMYALLRWLTTRYAQTHTAPCWRFSAGDWSNVDTISSFGGSVKATTKIGASANVRFNGDAVTLFVSDLPAQSGTATVRDMDTDAVIRVIDINGLPDIVASRTGRLPGAHHFAGFGPGEHGLKIELTSGPRLAVNAVGIPSQYPPTIIQSLEGGPTRDVDNPFHLASIDMFAEFPSAHVTTLGGPPGYGPNTISDVVHPNAIGHHLMAVDIERVVRGLDWREGQNTLLLSTVDPGYTIPNAPIAGPASTLVLDSFNREDQSPVGAPTVGTAAAFQTNAAVTGQRLRLNAGGFIAYPMPEDNYSVQFKYTAGADSGFEPAVAFRLPTAANGPTNFNCYYWQLRTGNVFKKDPSPSGFFVGSAFGLSPSETDVIKVEVFGPVLRFFKNDNLIASLTDPDNDFPAPGHVVFQSGSFDDLLITSP